MNKVILSGNLVKDIELKQSKGGAFIVKNTVAVSRDRKEADGTYGTDFINITIWGKIAEYLNKYAKKGDHVELTGRWATSQNNKTINHECVVESLKIFFKKHEEIKEEQSLPLVDNGIIKPEEINVCEEADDLPF